MSLLQYIDHQVFPGIIQHWLRQMNVESGAYTYKYSMNMAKRPPDTELPVIWRYRTWGLLHQGQI